MTVDKFRSNLRSLVGKLSGCELEQLRTNLDANRGKDRRRFALIQFRG